MAETAILEEILVPVGDRRLPAEFELPKDSSSLVIFCQGNGSSGLSSHNQFVAESLREKGISTFLFDLLEEEEDAADARFDIDLLTRRLVAVTRWIKEQPFAKGLKTGYFGASTGAAAALNASVLLGNEIKAVVSRGGRPDLSMTVLPDVKAATLLIVGSLDAHVLQLNKKAFNHLASKKEYHIISGAGHQFSEPGKLEEVSSHAIEWFQRYLEEK